jgi:hypothetical protein
MMQRLFPGMPHRSHPRERLYKQPMMPHLTHDAPGIHSELPLRRVSRWWPPPPAHRHRVEHLGLVADMGTARGRSGIALDATTRQRMALPIGDGRWSTTLARPQTQGPTCRALELPARQGDYLWTMS